MARWIGVTFTAAVLALAASAAAQAPAPRALTPADAASMQQKLVAITARANLARGSGDPGAVVRTSVSEREINAYLKFAAGPELPPGIVNPEVLIPGGGRLSGEATIDFDTVRKSEPRGWLDPLAYMGGSLAVKVIGTLRGQNGMATFTLESASAGGVAIPKPVLQALVSQYTKSPEYPNGIDIDKPFRLPDGIRGVELGTGRAVIVQ